MVALLSYLDAHPNETFVVIFDDLKRLARDHEFHFKLRAALNAKSASVECLNFNFDIHQKVSLSRPSLRLRAN